MKKLFTFLTMLVLGIGSMWAESKISKAVAGTYLFDSSNPALTVNKGGATVTNSDGAIIIHHNDLSTVTGKRTYATVVMRVDMPTTAPGSFSNFINLKPSNDYNGSIGLGVTTEGKLKGTWQGNEWTSGGGVVTTSAVTGEHTIVMLCNNSGTTIYVDGTSTSVNKDGLKGGTKWTDLRIEPDYASCVKSVYVLSDDQASNISDFFSELSNVVTVANEETKNVSDNSTATRFFVASGGTLTADVNYDADKIEVAGTIEIASTKTLNVNVAGFDLTKITGEGNVTLDADATISGSKSTVATGKLTINEGKTLTLGTGQGQANSIASFTSIDLAGTIKHNNSVATFNSVTVPTGKTGKIFAYDMGSTSDGFKLAGTTNLVGDLVVCSKYNFQMKVDVLDGSGSCLICGTTGDNYDASGTSSNEAATINIASASSYTGNATVNNSKATVNLAGNLVGSSWTKTNGTLNYAGNNLNGTTLDGVVLNSTTARITTSNTVNIKNLAGCNLLNPSGNYGYAFIGSGTINFYGTCDLTKKSDGTTDALSSNLGYGSSATIVVKENATLKAGVIFNTRQSENNASITVESGGTLTTIGWTHDDGVIYATNLVNNGTINISTGRYTSGYGISTIHTTLSGSGTLNIAAGSNFNVASIPNTLTLSGAGVVKLTTFPTSSAPTVTSWTGSIEFPSIATAQGNLAAIFNAWGTENSTIKLHSVTGWLPGLTTEQQFTVNPTLEILEGQTLTINNGSSGTTPVLRKITGAGNLEQTWTGGSNYTLNIATLTDFTGTLKGTKKQIVVKKLVIDNAPFVNTRLIKTTGTVTLEKLYIGLEETTAYSWETKTIDEVTGIYVTEIDQVQLYREMAVATVSPYFTYIGAGVGQYTISLGVGKNYTSISDFESAILAWAEITDCSIPILTLNQPTSGFYRFHIDNKYMCGIAGNDNVRTATETNNDASTIFYLNEDNYLISYLDGYGFNYGYCKATSPGIFNNFDFSESTLLTKYNIHSNAGTGDSKWSDRNITINTSDNKLAGGQGTWAIEPVTSLPVTFKKAGLGYATLYTPVALQIPENTNAYVCKLQEAPNNAYTLTFYEITAIKDETDHTTIPANTAVLLYRSGVKDGEEDVVVNFPITTCKDEEGEDVVITENSFYGTLATEAFDPNSTEEDIYSLRTYLKEDQAVKVGFYKKTTGTTCAGFKAWIKTDHPVNDEVRNIIISFDGVDDPTGIVEALGLENANVEIYDLNGRKMATYKKGINIVNGKKVLVK